MGLEGLKKDIEVFNLWHSKKIKFSFVKKLTKKELNQDNILEIAEQILAENLIYKRWI